MDLSAYADRPLTYDEVGATAGDMPPGYHHVDVRRRIGQGRQAFDLAGRRILEFDMHRGAGLRVRASTVRAEEGSIVVLGLGPISIPCRVVRIVDEPTRRGFVYGTLPGHPESGEESFVAEFDPATEEVSAHIRAFSRPGNKLVALGGPFNRATQKLMTGRYLSALARP
ncbi:DUF1990 family protein [Rhodococcoides trifolii]|nr:DUF1990 domain-containing protein [Rhodococcus trifolii]